MKRFSLLNLMTLALSITCLSACGDDDAAKYGATERDFVTRTEFDAMDVEKRVTTLGLYQPSLRYVGQRQTENDKIWGIPTLLPQGSTCKVETSPTIKIEKDPKDNLLKVTTTSGRGPGCGTYGDPVIGNDAIYAIIHAGLAVDMTAEDVLKIPGVRSNDKIDPAKNEWDGVPGVRNEYNPYAFLRVVRLKGYIAAGMTDNLEESIERAKRGTSDATILVEYYTSNNLVFMSTGHYGFEYGDIVEIPKSRKQIR